MNASQPQQSGGVPPYPMITTVITVAGETWQVGKPAPTLGDNSKIERIFQADDEGTIDVFATVEAGHAYAGMGINFHFQLMPLGIRAIVSAVRVDTWREMLADAVEAEREDFEGVPEVNGTTPPLQPAMSTNGASS